MKYELDAEAINYRIEKTGHRRDVCASLLFQLADSIHTQAGTLPEALWRYKFCAPKDSARLAHRVKTAYADLEVDLMGIPE